MSSSTVLVQETLPAGTYFIGDLYHALNEKYEEVVTENLEERTLELEMEDEEDPLTGEKKVYKIVFDYTFGGPGSYDDCYGKNYEIDSGLLAILPIEICDLPDDDETIDIIGQRIEFDEEVTVYFIDGVFLFHWENNLLKIDTKNKMVHEVEEYEYKDVHYDEAVFATRQKGEREYVSAEDLPDFDDHAEDWENDPENVVHSASELDVIELGA
jgi:hypothetical protein